MFIESELELFAVIETFNAFGLESGALLNTMKTSAIMIGVIPLTVASGWLQIRNSVKILGIAFHEDFDVLLHENWTNVLNGFQKCLWMNNDRQLNIVQKVILINTFASSKLWYTASILPLPKKFAGKFISRIGSFLWYG